MIFSSHDKNQNMNWLEKFKRKGTKIGKDSLSGNSRSHWWKRFEKK